MKKEKIAIIGAGNIGIAIAEGLHASGEFKASNIILCRRNLSKLELLKKRGFKVSSNILQASVHANYVVLAVQPKQLKKVLKEISSGLNKKKVLISVVTGVSISEIQAEVGSTCPLFVAMPNTAISVQESMTCIATSNSSKAIQSKVLSMFKSMGEAIIIEERLMAAATVLGACGIAFALRFIRATSQGGVQIGFDADVAQLITSQTVNGAASLLLKSGKHPEREIDRVTTPRGCTIEGLNEMEHAGFSSAVIKGLTSSHRKINTIA
ncbi:MAG: pyrroline-5-carboxylate reductase [Bacteroidetes bacterium]|nr:MAG: pyrroline-5-carboxylate reductase [Bacteroidota bacterium]